jgi:hypothetical protein
VYSYTLDGIPFSDPLGNVGDFTLTLERTFEDENLFREFSELSLIFTGRAYGYLCRKLAEDYCAKTAFELTIGNNMVYSGQIIASFGTINYTQGTYETQVVDTSYRGLIRERIRNDINLASTISVNCSPITPLPILNLDFFEPDGDPVAWQVRCYNVLDCLRLIIDVISDGTVDVQSAYLTANPYVITNGYNLGNNAGASLNRRYPVLSFERLYGELRKALALYASLEIISGTPTIIIEPESYWFEDAPNGFSIADFPYGMTINVDEDRIYSLSKIGSSDVDVDSDFNPFDNQRLDGWLLRTYNTCGCIFDRDNEQNLEADFIYDSGKIFKALVDRDETDDIYMIEIDPATNQPAKYLRVPTVNVFYYNDTLRNKNIAQRWADIFLNCAYDDRVSDVSFRAFSEFEDGDPLSCNVQRFDIEPTPISASGNMLYFQTDYDTFFALSQPPNSGDIVGATLGCGKSRFTVPVDGSYAFIATRDFFFQFPVLTGSNTVTFDVLFIIRAYDSVGGIKFSSSTLQQHVAVAPTDIWRSFVSNSTPLWNLVTGDYVEVIFSFQIVSSPSGLNVFGLFGLGEFKNNDELMACFDINPEGERIPYLIEATVPMCDEDYRLITDNRRGYVDLNGIKGWVKRLEYTPDKLGVMQLLTSEIPCCLEEQTCVWRVEGVNLCQQYLEVFFKDFTCPEFTFNSFFTFAITDAIYSFDADFILADLATNRAEFLNAIQVGLDNNPPPGDVIIEVKETSVRATYLSCSPPATSMEWLIFNNSGFNFEFNAFDYALSSYANSGGIGSFNWQFNVEQPQSNTFQIFQNGEWTTVTPTDGVYESANEFTQWRIIDSEGNVIQSGEPEIICT